MQYGYARISTIDQNPDMQLKALQRAGCKKVFKDEGISGSTTKRPALARCLKALAEEIPVVTCDEIFGRYEGIRVIW